MAFSSKRSRAVCPNCGETLCFRNRRESVCMACNEPVRLAWSYRRYTAALRVAVRRHPRVGADLYPPGLRAGAMAFPLSCRPGLARHLRRRGNRHRALGARVGTVAAENPKANLEVPDHGPAQRRPAQLCIGPAAVLGDSRVAGRRQWRVNTGSSSIVIRMP
jgi:hypothetical protein